MVEILTIAFFLLVATIWDLKKRIIPPIAPLGIFATFFYFENLNWYGFLTMFILCYLHFLAFGKNGGSMGGGDIKLFLSLALGLDPLLAFTLFWVSCSLSDLYMIITGSVSVPMAPFISTVAILFLCK